MATPLAPVRTMSQFRGPDLKLVFPEPSQTQDTLVDIVAVHGLGANPEKTWLCDTHDEAGNLARQVHWLKDSDMLPSLVPKARIWLFCYQSNLVGDAPIQQLDVLAIHLLTLIYQKRLKDTNKEKPIIFLGHSFGGIVIEAALTSKALTNPRFGALRRATSHTIFLGTPFQGTANAQLASYIANAAKAMGYLSSKTLLRLLRTQSKTLDCLVSDFTRIAKDNNIATICFYEQFPTKYMRDTGFMSCFASLTSAIVVPKAQASLDAAISIGLGTSHTKMNKFKSLEDENFQLVSQQIVGAYDVAARLCQKSQKKALRILPFSPNKSFLAREDIMQSIQTCFYSSPRVAALYGLPGTGKTQFATQFAYESADKTPEMSVFWVYAANEARFEQSYLEIAEQAAIIEPDRSAADNLHLVKRWLESEESGLWCLIVDNADNFNLFSAGDSNLAAYIPQSDRGLILFTSRDEKLCNQLAGTGSTIHIGRMEMGVCQQILRSVMMEDSYDSQDAEQVVTILENLPLAIAQAASFIEQNCLVLSQYADIFTGTQSIHTGPSSKDLEEAGPSEQIRDAFSKAWSMSYQQICIIQPQAASVLAGMAYFDRQELPREAFFRDGMPVVESQNILRTLQAFSMITVGSSADHFTMHQLVQLSLLRWAKDAKKSDHFVLEGMRTVRSIIAELSTTDLRLCARYIPHAQTLLGHAESLNTSSRNSKDQNERVLLYQVGTYCSLQGKYDLAHQYLERSLNLTRKESPRDQTALLEIMSELVSVYNGQAKFEQAERLGIQVLTSQINRFGPANESGLVTMKNLATAYTGLGKWGEAQDLYEQVGVAVDKKFGTDSWQSILSKSGLVHVYMHQARFLEAEKLGLKAYQVRKEHRGPEATDTLQSMADLAMIYRRLGRLTEAEKLQRAALQIEKRGLGPQHPSTVDSMHNLACILYDQSKWTTAEQVEAQVLIQRTKALGLNHPATLAAAANIALGNAAQNNLPVAERQWLLILASLKQAVGEENPLLLPLMYSYSYTLKSMGKAAEAKQLLEKVIELSRELLGDDHPETLRAKRALLEKGKMKDTEFFPRLLDGQFPSAAEVESGIGIGTLGERG